VADRPQQATQRLAQARRSRIARLGTQLLLGGLLILALAACGGDDGPNCDCRSNWTCTTLNFVQCEAIILAECNAGESSYLDGTCTLVGCGGSGGCICDACAPQPTPVPTHTPVP